MVPMIFLLTALATVFIASIFSILKLRNMNLLISVVGTFIAAIGFNVSFFHIDEGPLSMVIAPNSETTFGHCIVLALFLVAMQGVFPLLKRSKTKVS